MSAAQQPETMMTEPMTWEQICERFPDQHVFLVEVDQDDPFGFVFRTARVIGRGPTSDEAWEQAKVWRGQYDLLDHCFTGQIRVSGPMPRIVMTDEIRELVRVRGRPRPC